MKFTTSIVWTMLIATSFLACAKGSAPTPNEPEPPPRVFPVQPAPTAGQNADSMPETYPSVQTAMSLAGIPLIGGFYESVPALYKYSTKKYPLIITLHGVDDVGNGTTDLPKVLNRSIPKLISDWKFPPAFQSGGKSFSFIVMSPQFKSTSSARELNNFVSYVIKNYRVDTSRIYIVGHSMGGGLTWDYSVEYGRRIAASIPISGASIYANDARTGKIAKTNLPVWAFHNEDDPTVPVKNTLQYVELINTHNPEPFAKQTIWVTGGHDAWTKATDPAFKDGNINIYEWMLQYAR